MRYFLDTEFREPDGDYYLEQVELISLGIVSADGREFYAVSSEFDESKCGPWLQANVLAHLGDTPRVSQATMRAAVRGFVGEGGAHPQFWGYYADYDWYLFCRMMGGWFGLPKTWPKLCRDVAQYQEDMACPTLPSAADFQPAHNALTDARWTRAAWERVEAWRKK